MKFTGERYVPELGGEIRIEHLHRYAWAAPLCAGKVVLDLACGEGYGTALLARTAAETVGVDVSREAVGHASRRYRAQSNVRFLNASASSLPLSDCCFDVVVSFETIEHLSEQAEMLDEIRRVLKGNGILVISSPNRPVYGRLRNAANEYHVRELDFVELDSLLATRFKYIEYSGQRMIAGSAILADRADGTTLSVFADDGADIDARVPRLGDPVYFVAVCSNLASRSRFRAAAASLAVSEKHDPITFHHEVAGWAQSVDRELIAARARIGEMQAEHERTVAWALSLEVDVKAAREAHRASEASREASIRWAKQLDEDLGRARDAVARAAAEHKEAIEWARSLENELSESRKHYAALREEHEKVAHWAHGLEQELVETRQNAGTAERAQRETEKRVATLEALVGEHQAALCKTEQDLAEARSECVKLREAYATEVRLVHEARTALEVVRARAITAEERLRERDGQLVLVATRRAAAESQVMELSEALSTLRSELHAKQQVLEASEMEISQLTKQMDSVSAALAQATGDRQLLTTLLAEAGQKSEVVLKSLAASRQRILRLQEQVKDLSAPMVGR